ncbi:DsrE/DsrF/TusD sulfur relay family protein [Magnetospirillum sp. UT-4]|uniref:DsrE/DsrF/TusD sulfur relay family protein n=1 Tax=Magnetospirillum sp. UT-4 TaxID=2681467 RepID=UPI00138632E5|nr:DsrE family protein [Magnetospirillum sp. UT-4]CAA7614368.1 Protein YchN [Magnetospirillum sp. UT-4]
MKIVIILNDPPYGTERSYNGLRLAHSLKKNAPEAEITVFLMADAVLCAKAGQKTPEGFYNIEKMVHRVTGSGGRMLLCGTCMDARGIAAGDLTEGAARSGMDALSAAILDADKVMVF